MNDNHNPLDKSFRDKLIDHEIQPGEHVWEGIQSAMNKNSRRLWLIMAPLFLVLAALVFYMIAEINPTTPAENPSENPSGIIDNTTDDRTSLKETDTKNIDLNNTELTLSEKEIERQSDDPSGNSNTSQSVPSSVQTAQTQAENLNTAKNSRASASEQRSNSNDLSVKAQTADDGASQLSKNNKGANSALNAENQQADTKRESSTSSDLYPQSSGISTSGHSVTRSLLEETSSLKIMDEGFQRFTVAHFKNNEDNHKKALSSIDLCALMNPKTNECPTFKNLNRHFQLDLYGLAGKKFTRFSTNNSITGVGNYLEKRRTSETPLWNVGIGIRLANQWTNGISVKGGLQLSRGQVRLNYLDESQRTTVVNVSVDTLVDDAGNTTVVWDTISIVETNIVPVEEYNDFTQLDIPVTVGYTFLGRDFDIELNAGVMINVLFSKEGHILGPEEDEINSINPGEQGYVKAYREDLGVSLITSAALNYRLTDQISVFAEPQLRYFFQPVSPELYSLQESWFHVNLLLGTRYSF